MYLWLSEYHAVKIEREMVKLNKVRFLKSVINGWRQIMIKNNQKRINLHKVKAKLKERPELGRPILALKNFLAFRAFNKLFEGARLVRQEDEKTEEALCGYYMRMVKKTFLSLKLNSQLKF